MSHMKRLLDENPHGICDVMSESQQATITTLKDENRELLEALERLMDWHSIIGGDIADLWFMAPESADEEGLEGLEGTNQVWQQARDAIAKARGGE